MAMWPTPQKDEIPGPNREYRSTTNAYRGDKKVQPMLCDVAAMSESQLSALTCSSADFPVKTSAQPGSVPVWTGPEAGCGESSPDLYAIYVPEPSLSRTSQDFSPPQPMLETSIAAYVAGLVDGDGSIGIHRGRTQQFYPSVSIRLGWKGKDTLDWIKSLFGGSEVALEKRLLNEKHAEVYRWSVVGSKARDLAATIYPHLRVKRAQAATVIHLHAIWMSQTKDSRRSQALRLKALIQVLNRTGRSYALPVEGAWLIVPESPSPEQPLKWSATWPRQGFVRSGRLYAHRMLARRTAGSGCSSWPTPCTTDAQNVPYQKGSGDTRYPMLLGAVCPEKIWPTPRSEDSESSGARLSRGTVDTLTSAARVDWLTPQSRDHKGISQKVAKGLFTGGLPDQLAGLPAPARRNTSGSQAGSLPAADEWHEWQTPKTGDSHATMHHPERSDGGQPNLTKQVELVMRQPVVLNPRWVACLMGFPPDYLDGVEVPSRR